MTASRPLKLESLRLGFTFSKPSLRDSISTWQNSTWRVHVELEFLRLELLVMHIVDVESLRLGLLKVKPSLRDSSFKGLLVVTSAWSCVAQAVWSFHRAV